MRTILVVSFWQLIMGFELVVKINALFVFLSASHDGSTTWSFLHAVSGFTVNSNYFQHSTSSLHCEPDFYQYTYK